MTSPAPARMSVARTGALESVDGDDMEGLGAAPFGQAGPLCIQHHAFPHRVLHGCGIGMLADVDVDGLQFGLHMLSHVNKMVLPLFRACIQP